MVDLYPLGKHPVDPGAFTDCVGPDGKPFSRPQVQQKSEGALRFDAGKPRFELMPPDALEEVAKVYEFGAKKYGENNWLKGMSWLRVVGSMLRHTYAWLAGEEHDVESKLHPMAHVVFGALTIIAYSKRKLGEDNRPKVRG